MKPSSTVQCADFPCLDTRRASYLVPDADINLAKVSIFCQLPTGHSGRRYSGWDWPARQPS